jgi:xylulose-5-phosphate/fructose-6-phosphate phosphoketolase
VIGDGEAETGRCRGVALEQVPQPGDGRRGAAHPALEWIQDREPDHSGPIDRPELESLLTGYGYRPYVVEGDEPASMHEAMAATLDAIVEEIRAIQGRARAGGPATRPRWPALILVTPKGWTGPKEVDGKKAEGSWRSHQVPLAGLANHPEHLRQLETWMRSYRPEELFDDAGRLRPELAELAPAGGRRMGANPHANGDFCSGIFRCRSFVSMR